MSDFILDLLLKLKSSSKTFKVSFSVLFSLLIGILSLVFLSSCQSATRVVTVSSDGTYSIRYVDSKTPVNVNFETLN